MFSEDTVKKAYELGYAEGLMKGYLKALEDRRKIQEATK